VIIESYGTEFFVPGQLVGEYHMCLWCKADKFLDTTSVQQHMVDKGHCKMLRDKGDIFEFADFYDYRFVGNP